MVDEDGKEQECYPFGEEDEVEDTAHEHFLSLLSSRGVSFFIVSLANSQINKKLANVIVQCWDNYIANMQKGWAEKFLDFIS